MAKNGTNIYHLYFKKKCLIYSLEKSISKVNIIENMYDKFDTKSLYLNSIFLLELDSLDKEKLSKLKELICKIKKPSMVYILADKTFHTSLLLRFALFFKIEDVLDISLDEPSLQCILKKGLSKLKNEIYNQKMLSFSKEVNRSLMFTFYKNQNLVFASDALIKFFEVSSTSEVKNKITNFHELSAKKALKDFTCILKNSKDENWNSFYNISSSKDQTLVTFSPYQKIEDSKIVLNNRFDSIEWIKDSLIEKTASETSFILISIVITNKNFLLDTFSYLEYHDFIKDFLSKLSTIVPFKGHLTQWNDNSYVIGYIGEKEDMVKENIKLFLEDILQFNSALKPVVETSLWEIEKQELPHIISTLDKISQDSLNAKDVENMKFYTFMQQQFKSNKEEIIHLLHHGMLNKTPLKLLNIYKGLCIYTNSKVLKFDENGIYIYCEASQAYAMEESKKVIIHGPMFSKEIKASVNFVNIRDGYAIINSFEYLNSSANNRQYTRVQPNTRTSVFVKSDIHSYQGTIMDISLKSLALECRQSVSNLKKGMEVKINFRIPDYEDDMNIVQMQGNAQVEANIALEFGLTKIVLMMDFPQMYENYLIRYMYERQKELILELKNIARHNK